MQPPTKPAVEKIDTKNELEAYQIHLHNARHQVLMLEAAVKKLQELSR